VPDLIPVHLYGTFGALLVLVCGHCPPVDLSIIGMGDMIDGFRHGELSRRDVVRLRGEPVSLWCHAHDEYVAVADLIKWTP
jgi:hypothetical protein